MDTKTTQNENNFAELPPRNLAGTLLLVYIAVYLLIPYKPWNSVVSFHTPVMLFGIISLIPAVHKKLFLRKTELSLGSKLFVAVILTFTLSTLVMHSKEFSRPEFQGWGFSFLCFLFVRLAVRHLGENNLYRLLYIYLAFSGIFVLFQFNFGSKYFIWNYFGKNEWDGPGYGFANSATLQGGTIAWILSVLIARYSTQPGKSFFFFRILGLSSITLGTIALFYALNRAAWVGLAMALLGLWLILANSKFPKKNFVRSLASFIAVPVVIFTLISPKIAEETTRVGFFRRLPFNVKETIFRDGSANTRLNTWATALNGIKQSPFWGIGLGQFPMLYENSYPELQKMSHGALAANRKLDPHNSYLYYSVEMGIIPAAFLLVFIVLIIVGAMLAGPKAHSFPFLIGLIAVCVWIFFNDFIRERIFWIALAITAGLTPSHQPEK